MQGTPAKEVEVQLTNIMSSSGEEDNHSTEDSVTEEEVTTPPPKWVLYSMLVLAILLYGSIGVFFRQLKGPSTLAKVVWQMTMITIILSVPFLISFSHALVHTPEVLVDNLFTKKTVFLVLVCGVSFSFACITWFWAVEHTSISHACLLHETHPLILTTLLNVVFFAKCLVPKSVDTSVWKTPSWQQNFGCVLGFVSILIMSLHGGSGHGVTHKGDAVAFLGAFGMVIFLLASPHLSKDLPVSLYLVWVYFLMLLIVVGTCIWLDRPYLWTFDNTPWHNHSWWKNLVIFLQSDEQVAQVICSASCSCGAVFIISFMSQYFSPPSLAVCLLAEPLVATFFAVAVHAGPAPGPMTYVCGVGILAAIAITVLAEQPTVKVTIVHKKRFPPSRIKIAVPSRLRMGDDAELAGLLTEEGYRSDSPTNVPSGVFRQSVDDFHNIGDYLLNAAAVSGPGNGLSCVERPRLKRSTSVDTIHISRIAACLFPASNPKVTEEISLEPTPEV